MGKPSSRNSERRLSNNSTHSMSHVAKMPPKNSKEWNRLVSRNQANIRKSITGLFDKLRETTKSLNNNKSNSSVIVLDDTIDSPNSNKRKSTLLNRTVKRKKSLNGTIVEINDEDLVTNNNPCTSSMQTPKKTLSPIHSSTPNDKNLKSDKLATKSDNKDVINLTEEIDDPSYLTIDLTYNSDYNYNTANNTVIDLEKSADKSVPSGSHNNSSTSDDSNVTVLERSEFTKKNMRKYASHIGKLNASEKGRLLELLTDNIINGCKYNKQVIKKLSNYQDAANQSTETVEDAYIKDVIVGQSTSSHNSIGSNIYNPERDARNKVGLRMIVVDGSNVAMEHSKGKGFSVKGLKICIDYFLKRGHVVKAFVPRFRCKFGKSSDPRLLDHLERQGYVVYTPSREVQGKTITPYDDRYIVQCAAEFDAVIVSGDNYRDLMHENPKWKFVIENRLLQFTWVNDMLMFPRDPLGRNGPTLEEFLRHQPRNTASKHKDLKRVLNALQQGRLSLEEILRNLNAKPPQKPKRKKGYLKTNLRNNAMKTTATINSTTIQPTEATIPTGCQTRVVNWQPSTYSSKVQSQTTHKKTPSQAENQENTFVINDEDFPPLGESSQKLIRQLENQPNDPAISADRNEDRSMNSNSYTRTKLALNNAFRNICNKDARPQMEQLICEPENHPTDPAISADGDEDRSNYLKTYTSTKLALNNAFRSICNKGAKPQMEQLICQPANRPTEAANSASKEDNIPITQTDPQPAFAASEPTSHQFKMPINKAKKDNRFDLIRKRLNKRQQKKKRAELKRLKKTQARATNVANQNSKKSSAVSHAKTGNVVKCSESISKFPATPDFIPIHRGSNILPQVVYNMSTKNSDNSR